MPSRTAKYPASIGTNSSETASHKTSGAMLPNDTSPYAFPDHIRPTRSWLGSVGSAADKTGTPSRFSTAFSIRSKRRRTLSEVPLTAEKTSLLRPASNVFHSPMSDMPSPSQSEQILSEPFRALKIQSTGMRRVADQNEYRKDQIKKSNKPEGVINQIVPRSWEKSRGLDAPDLAAVRCRVLLLTIYCCLHYFLLTVGFWDNNVFHKPPPPPSLSELFPSNISLELHTKMTSFLAGVHPHVDGHSHLHYPLSTAMQRCLGMAAAEWIILLRLSSVTHQRRSELFGALVAILFFIQTSGSLCGGLLYKTPLFPDIWGFIFDRLDINFLQPNCLVVDRRFWLPQTWMLSDRLLQCVEPLPLINVSTTVQTLIPWSFLLIYFIDLLGALMSMISIYRFLNPKTLIYPGFLLIAALTISSHFMSSLPSPNAGDNHWRNYKNYEGREFIRPSSQNPPVYLTKYISMSDGVELAADIYLPPRQVASFASQIESQFYRQFYFSKLGLEAHQETQTNLDPIQIPTLLISTRYNRRMTVRWPFTMISLWGQPRGSSTANVWSWQFVDALVTNGYAVVVLDSRGTGASFGSRPVDFSPSEIQDFKEIHSWITTQFWSDGHISAGGFSYDGMTGLHLAGQTQLDAVLALFSPIDVVRDLIQPGGVVCSSFVEDYTGLTTSFEKLGSPLRHMLVDFSYDWQLVLGFLMVFGVAAPVKTREMSLPLAIDAHKSNWNMSAMVEELHFSDDFVLLPTNNQSFERLVVKEFGVTRELAERIVNSQAAVYIVAGYCDSSSVRGSTRLFEFLRRRRGGDKHELTIGPWTHTGRRNCSPYSGGAFTHFEFDMYWDILRFLDCHMKKKCWAPSQSSNSNVHFWSVGEERWISSSYFPPMEVKQLNLQLTSVTEQPGQNSYKLIDAEMATNLFSSHEGVQSFQSTVKYRVDYNATTRGLSRWVIAKHPFRMVSKSYRQLIPSSSYSRPLFKLRDFMSLSSADLSTGDLLLFTSPPLKRPLRIAGSPLLRFSLNLTAEFDRRAEELRRDIFDGRQSLKVNQLNPAPALDVTVFGYLEDVDNESGAVHYVTEGKVLLSHRPTVGRMKEYVSGLNDWGGCVAPPFIETEETELRQASRIGSADIVYQNGDQTSHRFSIGGVECVIFTFEPVAWLFRPGHSIRLSLAGADKANFHWSKTQIKEDADFLTRSLLSRIGSTDRLRELRQRPLHVERPHMWEIITDPTGFLKLPILEDAK